MAHDATQALSEDDVLSAEQIVGALERKRRQLDLQIENFKLLKDQEYRAHEQWLNKSARQRDVKPTRTAHKGQNGGQKSSPPTGREGFEPEWPKQSGSDGSSFAGKPINPVLTTAFYGQDGFNALIEQHQGQRSPTEQTHERDAEFAGVFTPMFLPLLDGSSGDMNHHLEEGKPSAYIKDENLASIGIDAQDPNTKLAASSTNKPSTSSIDSFKEGRHLSLNAPERNDHVENNHGRSASSEKSDISLASRRSSFKDPNTPRSPKRVMFDIDNTVVSPSTSPLVERKPQQQLMKKSKKTARDNDGDDQFEIVKKKPPHGKHKKHGYHRKGHQVAGEDRGRDLLPVVGDGNSTMDAVSFSGRRGETFLDDFEKVSVGGEEDLFSFDEDLDLSKETEGNEKWSDEAGFGGGGGGDEEAEGVGTSSAAAPVELTGTSPHAGSLPIEIRWPGRRNEGAAA